MKNRLPLALTLVAFLQFIPPLIMPPDVLLGMGPVAWVLALGVFAFLGYNLLQRRAWSRVATIFVQGFSIIIRLLVGVGHGLVGGKAGAPVDVALLATFTISIILSGIVLYYVDLPDVQIIMQ